MASVRLYLTESLGPCIGAHTRPYPVYTWRACSLARALLGQWAGELGELLVPYRDNLYVIPTSDDMFLLEPQMYGRAGREYLLNRFIEPLAGWADDTLIDCPPSLG